MRPFLHEVNDGYSYCSLRIFIVMPLLANYLHFWLFSGLRIVASNASSVHGLCWGSSHRLRVGWERRHCVIAPKLRIRCLSMPILVEEPVSFFYEDA